MIIAATAFFILFLHAAAAALIVRVLVKIHPGFLAHTIMYFHGNARRHRHVHYGQDGKEELFHRAKVAIISESSMAKAGIFLLYPGFD